MKNKSLYFLLVLFVLSCKSYDVQIKDFENASFKHVVEKTLKQYDAEEEKYSLLIFTNFYNGEKIIVENDKHILYQNPMKTIENFGLAKMIRIDNNYDVKIKDIGMNIKVVVKSNLAKTHKFIYIEKDKYVKDGIGNDSILNTKKTYKIIYSNTLLGFM
ncbi:hypothetical protein [Flavobacterium sp. 1355]|uniref:hypothetical protein n=1 Tax=Flavobacterium sp. 1355 TaxID=2806571 RepID=UPI001AE40B81|nr:hypothetical protein [Flavobacterium sp. 1355]MBP1221753.1 hypothetical protein [Flavobacterium sp. 1355]